MAPSLPTCLKILFKEIIDPRMLEIANRIDEIEVILIEMNSLENEGILQIVTTWFRSLLDSAQSH